MSNGDKRRKGREMGTSIELDDHTVTIGWRSGAPYVEVVCKRGDYRIEEVEPTLEDLITLIVFLQEGQRKWILGDG